MPRIHCSRLVVASLAFLFLARAVHADATAPCNVGGGPQSTECGVNSTASGNAATAVGDTASATGSNSTALGSDSAATGALSTAIGSLSSASGLRSTAVGISSTASDTQTTAIGRFSHATALDATAVGDRAMATGISALAVGTEATASDQAATAIGTSAEASGINSLALGNQSTATASNAVALGAGSVADQADTVSVGAAGFERRVTNVADGTNATDAVNLGQLQGVGNMASSNLDLIRDLDRDVDDLRDESRRGVAASVALVTLTPSAPGKTVVNVGWGHYKSENAVGLTINHRLKIWEERNVVKGTVIMLNAGASYGVGGDGVVRAGASFEF